MSTDIQDTAPLRIGLVSISDRASSGTYQDQGIPAMAEWLDRALSSPWLGCSRLLPDDREAITRTLRELADTEGCHLILTTGGTGPARRDVTPEATLAVADREMPGFGEQMRSISLHFVPTAILSRQTAVIRGNTLIINLPGQPKSIREILEGVRDAETGEITVPGIFSAVPYCLDLIGAPYIETNPAVCKAFRPRSALRPSPETVAAAVGLVATEPPATLSGPAGATTTPASTPDTGESAAAVAEAVPTAAAAPATPAASVEAVSADTPATVQTIGAPAKTLPAEAPAMPAAADASPGAVNDQPPATGSIRGLPADIDLPIRDEGLPGLG